MKMQNRDTVKKLAESAVLIAAASVLSVLKILQLPFGGSVTFASALPILLIAYRYGTGWGVGSALAYGVIQQLLGLGNLSYVSGWVSVVAVVLLDYLAAFGVFGLGGVFRGKMSSQSRELMAGALLISALRFLCHFIAGAFVWVECVAALPDFAGISYSLGYTATYMIPETLVLVAVANYVGSSLDFRLPMPRRISAADGQNAVSAFRIVAGFLLLAGAVADVLLIFPHLQSEEGFSLAGFADVPWVTVAVISATAVAIAVTLRALEKSHTGKK